MTDADQRMVNQFNRWYERLFRRIGWGWDVPTLAAVHPEVYNSYKRLIEMSRPLRQRLKENRS